MAVNVEAMANILARDLTVTHLAVQPLYGINPTPISIPSLIFIAFMR